MLLAALHGLLLAPAQAADPLVADTLRPYLNNQVNGLELHHYYLQSMLARDEVPLTVGTAVRASPVSYLMSDDSELDGGLAKGFYILSFGGGNPTSDGALFGGVNISQVGPSDFPAIWAPSGTEANPGVDALGTSAVIFAGVAVQGVAVEVALHRKEQHDTADDAGRFSPGGCYDTQGCYGGREVRPGAPVQSTVPIDYRLVDNAWMINVEHADGYHAAVLIETLQEIDEAGAFVAREALAAFRFLAQPTGLLDRSIGLLGAGLNTYAPSLDYYGDRVAETVAAAEAGAPPPPTPEKGILELPLVANRLADTGAEARVVLQARPQILLRTVEVGYIAEGEAVDGFSPQLGVRGRAIYRDDGFTASGDAFVGFAWDYRESSAGNTRGVGANVSYSYNSPDSLTFVPLPDAHVVGFSLVFGNPHALPPPVPIARQAEEEVL